MNLDKNSLTLAAFSKIKALDAKIILREGDTCDRVVDLRALESSSGENVFIAPISLKRLRIEVRGTLNNPK